MAGTAAPFVMLGALLLASGAVAVRTARPGNGPTAGDGADGSARVGGPQRADEAESPGRHTRRVRY